MSRITVIASQITRYSANKSTVIDSRHISRGDTSREYISGI